MKLNDFKMTSDESLECMECGEDWDSEIKEDKIKTILEVYRHRRQYALASQLLDELCNVYIYNAKGLDYWSKKEIQEEYQDCMRYIKNGYSDS